MVGESVYRYTSLLTDGNEQDLTDVINTNVLGLTYCTKQVYSKLRKLKAIGHIININSLAGHYINGNDTVLRNLNIYPSSKHAVTVLTEIIRRELVIEQNRDVRVTVKIPT